MMSLPETWKIKAINSINQRHLLYSCLKYINSFSHPNKMTAISRERNYYAFLFLLRKHIFVVKDMENTGTIQREEDFTEIFNTQCLQDSGRQYDYWSQWGQEMMGHGRIIDELCKAPCKSSSYSSVPTDHCPKYGANYYRCYNFFQRTRNPDF